MQMTMEQAAAHLTATYEEWIGYNPIAEGWTTLEVAQTIEEYANEVGFEFDDKTALAVRTVNESWQ